MKKGFILLCFCCLTFTGFSQRNTFQQEISLGGSAGVSFASVSFSPRIQQNMLLTYNAGFTARWISEKNCGIQLEINYLQQGWDEFFDDPQYHYTRRLNYVEVPFLSHFYAGNRRVRVIFNLGPQIGYLLGDSYDHNLESLEARPGPNNNNYSQQKERSLAIQNKFGWGLTGGAGMEIRTGIGNFLLEGRYYYSLGDIFKNGKTDPFGKSSPQIITVKLSYLVPIVRK